MPPRIISLPFRPAQRQCSFQKLSQRPQFFSTSSTKQSNDPAKDLKDAISPSKSPRPNSEPTSIRPPSTPSDASNPMLHGYPSRTGRMTTSTASPDSTTPQRPSGTTSSYRQSSSEARDILGKLPQATQPSSRGQPLSQSMFRQLRDQPYRRAKRVRQSATSAMTLRQIENQQSRQWAIGDVYAPHDLSPVEQTKTRSARSGGRKTTLDINTRSKAQRDVIDELAIDPVKEYKNPALMKDFVTDMGRIKHSRLTGLRPVNQRRIAKAIRRAVGLGILPSVHHHPELLPKRPGHRNAIARDQAPSRGLF